MRSVERSYRYDLETFEELRHVDAVAAFVRHEIDNMGWTLDPKARAELESTGRLSGSAWTASGHVEQVQARLQGVRVQHHQASFPDDRPFESNVLDIQ
ncbi:MAG: hypothetical protein IPG91_02435 [Ideonella sp.]|nr:hypothetical protein [Ideonella sp.]